MTPAELMEARRLKKLSLIDVASRLGIDPLTLAAIEVGELAATPELLAAWTRIVVDAKPPRGWGWPRRRGKGD